jgi:hypothetical protein
LFKNAQEVFLRRFFEKSGANPRVSVGGEVKDGGV